MTKRIIFQGITAENHLTALQQLLEIPNPTHILLSTAFMTEGGFSLIKDQIEPLSNISTLIVGIRNGITSAQGILSALESRCSVLAVDTGSRNTIFHPKLFLSKNATHAKLLIGSANLTTGGLNSNIEAGLLMDLDLSDQSDNDLVSSVEARITEMQTEFPEHVFSIPDRAFVENLLEAGRVTDERLTPSPAKAGVSLGNRELDTIPKIKLKTTPIRTRRSAANAPTTPTPEQVDTATTAAELPVYPVAAPIGQLQLVWESSPLTRRDLTIPTAEDTNQTGSMLWKKGSNDINQQTYFRDSVFNALNWQDDERTLGKELATAEFQIIIRGVDYGVHSLVVTHDTRTNTATYMQRQPMSAVRWGDARAIIAREDLLDRTMSLYRVEGQPTSFVLEVD